MFGLIYEEEKIWVNEPVCNIIWKEDISITTCIKNSSGFCDKGLKAGTFDGSQITDETSTRYLFNERIVERVWKF